MSNFINYTNHRLSNWSDEQIASAEKYGRIVDIPFPAVSPNASESEIAELADFEVEKIMAQDPAIVLCQGEFTLCLQMIIKLKARGIKVVAATSRRDVVEDKGRKVAVFKFVKFREYCV